MLDYLQGDFGVQIVSFFQSGWLGEILWYLLLPFHYFGSEKAYLLIIPPIYWCFNKSMGKRLLILLILGTIISGLFKIWWECPRPFHVSSDIRNLMYTDEYGLPSGHTVFGTIFGLTLFNYSKYRWQRITCLLFVFCMGISRLVHGMHFLQDVLLGWAIGWFIVQLGSQYDKISEHLISQQKPNTKMLFFYLAIFMAIPCCMILNIENLSYSVLFSLGGLIGGIVGLLMEKNKVPDFKSNSIRFIFFGILMGISLLIGIYFTLNVINFLLDVKFLRDWNMVIQFSSYTILGFTISYIIPLLISKANSFLQYLTRSSSF